MAVAPSDANRIYVGSGEGLQRPDLSVGDGVYRSDDGGKTWRHMGLRDGLQIPAIVVSPTNKDELYVGVLGHQYGPNAERGVFKSTNGGQTWAKVLYIDEDTGAAAPLYDFRAVVARIDRDPRRLGRVDVAGASRTTAIVSGQAVRDGRLLGTCERRVDA